MPLVTIGIPTFNRAQLLKRAVESAMNQDYPNIEIVVSDNASSDETKDVCLDYEKNCGKFKFIAHEENRGANENFDEVRRNASGEYLMLLGDDDWIDSTYVSQCMKLLIADPTLVLVSGAPKYYRNGVKFYDGIVSDITNNSWWARVVYFYWQVTDNGLFYGVAVMEHIRKMDYPKQMGGDWHMVAGLLATGKAKCVSGVFIHREIGASLSFEGLSTAFGLPRWQSYFPYLAAGGYAAKDILYSCSTFSSKPLFTRAIVGMIVLIEVVILKAGLFRWGKFKQSLKGCLKPFFGFFREKSI